MHEHAATGDVRLDSPLIHERLRSSIEGNLMDRGYRKSESPDFFIGYHLSMEQKMDIQTINTHYGYGGYGRHGSWGTVGYPETRVRQYEVGTLVIDVAAAAEKKLVWRGWGTDRLQKNPKPEGANERVRAVVDQILDQFPPQE